MVKKTSAILSPADVKAKAKQAAANLKAAQKTHADAQKAVTAANKALDAEVKAVVKSRADNIKALTKAAQAAGKAVEKLTPAASSPKL